MNEQKILNGLRAVRNLFYTFAVVFILTDLAFYFFDNAEFNRSERLMSLCIIAFWVPAICVRTFIEGYEKKV